MLCQRPLSTIIFPNGSFNTRAKVTIKTSWKFFIVSSVLNLHRYDDFHISFPKYMPKICNKDSKVVSEPFLANLERFLVVFVVDFEHVFAHYSANISFFKVINDVVLVFLLLTSNIVDFEEVNVSWVNMTDSMVISFPISTYKVYHEFGSSYWREVF